MKGKLHPPKMQRTYGEWYEWFAWRPVRVKISPALVPPSVKPAWRWVWWETIEKKVTVAGIAHDSYWVVQYRLRPKDEVNDEQSAYNQ